MRSSCRNIAFSHRPRMPTSFDLIRVIKNGTVYDGTGGEAATGRCRDSGRSDRGRWRFQIGESEYGDRCEGAGGRAGVHQHAFVVNGVADSGWPFTKRNPAGRHDRDHGRRRIDGAGERSRARAHVARAKGHQIRHQVEHAGGISAVSREARRVLQCRVVHRRDDDSRIRHRIRR